MAEDRSIIKIFNTKRLRDIQNIILYSIKKPDIIQRNKRIVRIINIQLASVSTYDQLLVMSRSSFFSHRKFLLARSPINVLLLICPIPVLMELETASGFEPSVEVLPTHHLSHVNSAFTVEA